MNWPARTISQPSDFVARIPFQRAFSFDRSKGKSLVMDIRSVQSTLGPNDRWLCAMIWPDNGAIRHNNLKSGNLQSCWLLHARFYSASTRRLFMPGGRYAPTWFGTPRNAPCLASIGFQGDGGKWGNWKLPIYLREPGCYWWVASVFFWPFQSDFQGVGRVPALPIPNDKRVIGLTFYDQSACLTPALNRLGFVTLFSLKILIGSGHKPNAAWVATMRDTQPPALWANMGLVNYAIVARFDYK
ncbi:MAG: hypothetical protein ACE5F1_06275 [Planctomycetota bacterium]